MQGAPHRELALAGEGERRGNSLPGGSGNAEAEVAGPVHSQRSGARRVVDEEGGIHRLRHLGDVGNVARVNDRGVAVAVLSGAADCGMGIYAAANALHLDFIPMEKEQYDLIMPSSLLNAPNIQVVLQIIQTQDFRKRVTALGGYDASESGQFWMEVG